MCDGRRRTDRHRATQRRAVKKCRSIIIHLWQHAIQTCSQSAPHAARQHAAHGVPCQRAAAVCDCARCGRFTLQTSIRNSCVRRLPQNDQRTVRRIDVYPNFTVCFSIAPISVLTPRCNCHPGIMLMLGVCADIRRIRYYPFHTPPQSSHPSTTTSAPTLTANWWLENTNQRPTHLDSDSPSTHWHGSTTA